MFIHYLQEFRKTTPEAYYQELADAIQSEKTKAERAEKARELICHDARIAVKSVSIQDYRENILNYIFSPLGYIEHDSAVRTMFFSTCLFDIRQAEIKLFENGIIDDIVRTKLFIRYVGYIAEQGIYLGIDEIPEDIQKEIDRRKADYKPITDNNGVDIASIEILERQTQAIAEVMNTPPLTALSKALRTSKREYENPNQISLFDFGRLVDTWEDSDNPDARRITVDVKAKNGDPMSLLFAIDDYKRMLKDNPNAHKTLIYMYEQLKDSGKQLKDSRNNHAVSFSIAEFADRLGIDIRDARKALKTSKGILENIKYESSNGYIQVFPTYLIGKAILPSGQTLGTRGNVTIGINPLFDIDYGGTFTRLLPKYIWSLNGNAWFLADYVYSILRFDAKNIHPNINRYSRELSLLSVLQVLNLSHPNEIPGYRIEHLIIDPIRNAVDQVNKTEKANNGALSLFLDIDYQKSPVNRILDGKLKITVNQGECLERLKKISQGRIDHIQRQERKRQKDEDTVLRAKGRKLATLEHKEKAKGDIDNGKPKDTQNEPDPRTKTPTRDET